MPPIKSKKKKWLTGPPGSEIGTTVSDSSCVFLLGFLKIFLLIAKKKPLHPGMEGPKPDYNLRIKIG
jgi:hypothetical protein